MAQFTQRLSYSLLVFLLLTVSACGSNSGQDAPAASETDEYVDAMAEQHSQDSPEATRIAQQPVAPVQASMVTYGTQDGSDLQGYMALPEDTAADAALPAVIVIHEWWGLNDNVKAMTRMLAAEGYRALAVDLYDQQTAANPQEAEQLMNAAMSNVPTAQANMTQAHQFLSETYNAPRVGTLGWCFGGAMSLQAALAMPEQIDATVIYYGFLVNDREQLATLDMPVLGIFGSEDGYISVEDVNTFEQILTDVGVENQIEVYEGAGHAFANPSGEAFQEEAAQDAWQKTTAFLAEILNPASS